jgi:hypothetical protein
LSLDESRIRQIIREEIEDKVFPILVDHANADEANSVNLKQRIGEIVGIKEKPKTSTSVSEADFRQRCYTILKNNGSTIKNHFSPEGFQYYYWQFEKYSDRFYRVKKAS